MKHRPREARRSNRLIPRKCNHALIAALCAAGLVCLWWTHGDRISADYLGTVKDFTGILAGSYLGGTPDRYNPDANMLMHQRLAGVPRPDLVSPRLPYYDMLLKPLTWLPYRTAVAVWLLLSVCAVALFVVLFPEVDRRLTAVAACWSEPVADALMMGQDVTFVLVPLAGAMILHRRGRDFSAGALLCLCAAKYHLFVLTPILVLVQRRWHFVAGLATGATALIFSSMAMQGATFLRGYVPLLFREQINNNPILMPTLTGQLRVWGAPVGIAIAGAVGVIYCIWRICQRWDFSASLSACVLGGILISPHAYLHDYTLAIPAFLVAATRVPGQRVLAVAALLPFGAILLRVNTPLGYILLVVISLVLLLRWEGAAMNAQEASITPRVLPSE